MPSDYVIHLMIIRLSELTLILLTLVDLIGMVVADCSSFKVLSELESEPAL